MWEGGEESIERKSAPMAVSEHLVLELISPDFSFLELSKVTTFLHTLYYFVIFDSKVTLLGCNGEWLIWLLSMNLIPSFDNWKIEVLEVKLFYWGWVIALPLFDHSMFRCNILGKKKINK